MKNKTDFYRLFFEQLARRGFQPRRSESTDYIADIYHKGQLIAYYTKADTVTPCTQTQILTKDKQFSKLMNLINDTAQVTALKAGICTVCPYTDAHEKLANGWYKLSEYNNVTLAAREHHLFGFVFNTYLNNPKGEAENRRVFYNKEFAGQDFAVRSGLVDEKALFTETELKVIHSDLVKMNILDNNVSNDDRMAVGRIIDKIEDIIPELREKDYDFDYESEFMREVEIGD
ncbi:MAG TPA: hypothetical protein DEP23_02275 [Ruminococcaceae bacterium]|nr:hypothetical protein [Oscillospiraceae bacterium]